MTRNNETFYLYFQYSEILYEIDLILKNIETMRAMTLAVNAKKFNGEYYLVIKLD